MRCINFDREFERYIAAWMKEHAKEYRTYDDMEAAMPDVYAQFLDTPVNWLQGMKPGEYFGQFDNARQLVNGYVGRIGLVVPEDVHVGFECGITLYTSGRKLNHVCFLKGTECGNFCGTGFVQTEVFKEGAVLIHYDQAALPERREI